MGSLVCGAIKRNGMPCGALSVIGSGRCKHHGGMSLGPRTLAGKVSRAAALKLVIITNGGKGKPKTDKARKHREAMARRRKLVEINQARRAARWEQKKRERLIAQGIPLVPDPSKVG